LFGTHKYVQSELKEIPIISAPDKTPAWQPPELPEGCKTAYLTIGPTTWPIDLDQLQSGKPFIPRPLDFISIYLKHNRLHIRSAAYRDHFEKQLSPDFLMT